MFIPRACLARKVRQFVPDGFHRQTDLLFGKSAKGNRDTFLYLDNAVRQGAWKYLRAEHKIPGYARDTKREKVEELYNLETDLGETRNLAKEHPEKVAALKKLMDELKEGVGDIKLDGPVLK